MADKGLVSKSVLTAIADAIRGKNKAADKYTPAQMADAITNLNLDGGPNKIFYNEVKSDNYQVGQTVTITPTWKQKDNTDGSISPYYDVAVTIQPHTWFAAGTATKDYDVDTGVYTLTITDATPEEGKTDGEWSIVYQQKPEANAFYGNEDYSGTALESDELVGNIWVKGMETTDVASSSNYSYPQNGRWVIKKYKNNVITSAGYGFLDSEEGITYLELENLVSVGSYAFRNLGDLESLELPNLTSAGSSLLAGQRRHVYIPSIELPKLTSSTLYSSGWSGFTAEFLDYMYRPHDNYEEYCKAIVCRNETVPDYNQSSLRTPVIYIVPNDTITSWQSKVRSSDYVVALEGSPFHDGKTVAGNKMKTAYNALPSNADSYDGTIICYPVLGIWEKSQIPRVSPYFAFCSKLTRENGYTFANETTISVTNVTDAKISINKNGGSLTVQGNEFHFYGYGSATYFVYSKGYKTASGTFNVGDNVSVTLEEGTDPVRTYNLSYPFTDGSDFLTNLVDGSNFEIAETPTVNSGSGIKSSIINGSKSFKVNNGVSFGYIKFHTPFTGDADLLKVSVTCACYAESAYDVGLVYVNENLVEVTSNVKNYVGTSSAVNGTTGYESSKYGHVLFYSRGNATRTYYTNSTTLKADTDYYLCFAYTKDYSGNSNWDRLSITNISFTTTV